MNQRDHDNELIIATKNLIDEFKVDLINMLINERGLKSDSNTIKSLEVVVNESSKYVGLLGVEYIYYVIHGRGPGRFPPPDPITGEWKIPFPVAKHIAEFGNKDEYLHVANAFDKLYDELISKVVKKSSETSLAYIKKIGTLKTIG
jgi:hypothetical protein